MGREEACRRLAGSSPRIIPGIGPKTAERLAALGLHDDRRAAARRRGRARRSASARATAATCSRRAHFHGSDVVEARVRAGEVALERDDVRPRHRRPGRARGACSRGSRASSARGCSASRRAGARSRSRSGSTTGRRSRARARCPAPVNDDATVTGVALELLRAYAPPRPVRLLGVRVAAFEEPDAERPTGDDAGSSRCRCSRRWPSARRQDRAVAAEAEPLRRWRR